MDKFKNLLIFIIAAFIPFLLIVMILRFSAGMSAEFRFNDFWNVLETFPYSSNLEDLLTCIRDLINSINNLLDILKGVSDFSILGIIRGLWSIVYQGLITILTVLLLPFKTIYYILEWLYNVVQLFLGI